MSKIVNITIDDRQYLAEEGEFLVKAAAKNDIYIPTLCNIKGLKPRGSCRLCTVKINGRFMASCTTPVLNGMRIEVDTPELKEFRKMIIEGLLAEGNHFCPACEKSGSCELQAHAYRMQIAAPRFPLLYPQRSVDANHPKLIKDHNRCILCKRCIRAIKTEDGKSIFAYKKRGHKLEIAIDPDLGRSLSDEIVRKAIEICPVGALLPREEGFTVPIGKRTYDNLSIEEVQTQG